MAKRTISGLIVASLLSTLAYGDGDQSSPARIQREWQYLQQRATAGMKQKPVNRHLFQRVLNAIDTIDRNADRQTLEKKHAELSAKVFHLLKPQTDVAVSFCPPYSRLQPTDIPPVDAQVDTEIITLPGEFQAVGLTLASGSQLPLQCRMTIEGFDASRFSFVVRKQAFVEEYYKREATRIVDPLSRVARDGESWVFTLSGGEMAKLCLMVKTADELKQPDDFQGTVKLAMSNGQETALSLTISVLPVPRPERLPFLMFARGTGLMTTHADLVAQDLADHGVTMLQMNTIPRATFTPQGDIASVDFQLHDRVLRTYAPHIQKLLIFWPAMGYTKFQCDDGSHLEYMSKPWRQAYVNLLRTWRTHVDELGYSQERFVHHPDDEPASSDINKAPTERVLWAQTLMELTRSAIPDATVSLTLCDYAFEADVRLLAPCADIIMVGLPYRSELPRRAPTTYNPRVTLRNVVWPLLKTLSDQGKAQTWVYHCQSGKKGDVLGTYRVWPITQVVAGQTGGAHWAYDDIGGSSWDDTDGKRLDFLFVYDGTEEHPINQQINPTGETLVPSIRYEALRAGLQDAAIIVYVKDVLDRDQCPKAVELDVRSLLAEVQRYTKTKETVSYRTIESFSGRLRMTYSRLIANSRSGASGH